MKVQQVLRPAAAGLLTAVLAACSGTSGDVSRVVQPSAAAAVRFVNAVPDTMAVDYRFVDIVTNASEPSVGFRANSGNFRRLDPGTHRLRVFLAGTTAAGNAPSVVSTVMLDTTLTFQAGHYYTIVHAGYAAAGSTVKQRLVVIDDASLPKPPAGQIAVRVINAAPTVASADVYATIATATGGAVSGSPAFSNVVFGTASAFVNLAAAPSGTGNPTYRMAVTANGTTTPVLVDALLPVGTPAAAATATTAAVDAVAGSEQAQSVLTFVIFSPGVPYTLTVPPASASAAATTSRVTPPATAGASTLLDANPPRTTP